MMLRILEVFMVIIISSSSLPSSPPLRFRKQITATQQKQNKLPRPIAIARLPSVMYTHPTSTCLGFSSHASVGFDTAPTN